ncbi:uncharacterized protein LOC129231169 [Uloborus diversus]|uniref:uncharacterized protein LOC129231169 n=1 Tax=Uloborus diversus TaxID=327109 RepID=UPI0024092149|nr:uncharacterized protein LOC129231169 [Uloborus diversus]
MAGNQEAVQGQSSTDHIDWHSHLQSPSSHVTFNNSHFLVLPNRLHNSSLHFFPTVSPEANSDVVPLVLYAVLSVLGTTVNIFEISSLIIQENLRHHGNVFLANQALANLLIATLGFPASCIAILSNSHRQPFVCYWQWYSALISFFTSTVNYFFIAFENLLRAYRKRSRNRNNDGYSCCCSVQVVVFCVFFCWFAAAAWVLVLIFYDKRQDVCSRNYGYSITFLIFLAPVSLTLLTFGLAIHRYKRHLRELELRQCLESREESLHRQLFKSNALAYFLFLCFWMPYAIAVTISTSESISLPTVPPTSLRSRAGYESPSPNSVETLLGIAQSYSCFCGLVYAFTNSSFGQAFIYLTRYFCCKAHPEFTKSTFQEKPRGTVRVHIGMETRVGDRSARANKLMAVMMHDSPRGGRAGNHYL